MAVITGPGQGNKIPSGYKQGQIQKFTPEMMELWQTLFSHLGPDSYLSRLAGGDEDIFKEIESPALQQFAGMQGNIASRFSQGGGGAGSMSARRSSGFQNTMNKASSDFAQQLQAQRQQLRQQAIKDLMGMSNDLLNQNPYEQYLVPKKEKKSSGWSDIVGTMLGGAGGFAFGGPSGVLPGAKFGHDVSAGLF